MAVVAKVIGKYWTRRNNTPVLISKGTEIVVPSIPENMKNRLEFVRAAKKGELIVNDSPQVADLRAQGKNEAADRVREAEAEARAARESGYELDPTTASVKEAKDASRKAAAAAVRSTAASADLSGS